MIENDEREDTCGENFAVRNRGASDGNHVAVVSTAYAAADDARNFTVTVVSDAVV
jgi:hypothetical protein